MLNKTNYVGRSLHIETKLLEEAKRVAKRAGARSLNAFFCEAIAKHVERVRGSQQKKSAAEAA